MTRGVFNATVVNQTGDIQPNSGYEVRDEAGDLATIFDVATGGVAIANPNITDANAFFRFYTEQGRYTITATDNETVPNTVTWVVDINPTDDRDGPLVEMDPPRTTKIAESAVEQGSDGDYFSMAGRFYRLDSTLLGTDSATYDLGVPGIMSHGPVYLDQFGDITEDTTDVGPIIQRALDALGGTEPLNVKPGSYLWETPVLISPTDYEVYESTSFYRAPILRGSHTGGVLFKTSIDDYMMEFGRPWTGTAVLAKGMELSNFSVQVEGTPTSPKMLRMLAQNDGLISNIYTAQLSTTVRFDADDPNGDRQASSGMRLEQIRSFIKAGGTGIEMTPSSVQPSVVAAYINVDHCSLSGGDYAMRVAATDQMEITSLTATTQAVDNLFFEWVGLPNRNININHAEIGNNTSMTGGFIRAQSLNNSNMKQLRMIRNSGEAAVYGYYLQDSTVDAQQGTINNVKLEQDLWIITDSDAFVAYEADSAVVSENVEIIDPYYLDYGVATNSVSVPYKYSKKQRQYVSTQSSEVIYLEMDNVDEHRVSLTPTATSAITVTRLPELGRQNERSVLTVSNSGTADATLVYSGVSGALPGTIAPGETYRAETLFDRLNNNLIILGSWTQT